MRKTIAALAVVAAAASAAAIPAFAQPDPWLLLCQFASNDDPTAEGFQTGELSGGPAVLTDDALPPGVLSGTLTGRIQVTVADHTGTGPSVSGHGTAVVTAGPAVVSYQATATDPVYLCSEFTDDATGTTYYYDDGTQTWSTSPLVGCGLATSTG